MRAHTLVLVLLGDDPPPLEVLVERLVQQLQATPSEPARTITNLAPIIPRKKINSLYWFAKITGSEARI